MVSTIGYGGFLVGAPLIGFLAHMMPLDRALLAVAVLVLLIAVFAPAARERGAEPAKAKDEALTHNEAHTGRDIPSRAQQAQVAPTTVVDI